MPATPTYHAYVTLQPEMICIDITRSIPAGISGPWAELYGSPPPLADQSWRRIAEYADDILAGHGWRTLERWTPGGYAAIMVCRVEHEYESE